MQQGPGFQTLIRLTLSSLGLVPKAIEVVTNCEKQLGRKPRSKPVELPITTCVRDCMYRKTPLFFYLYADVCLRKFNFFMDCESMNLRLPQHRPPQRWRHLFLPECCVIATICCYCWISTNNGLLSFSFFLDLRIQNLLMIAFLFFLD